MKQIVFQANEVDKEARSISQSPPEYPSDAETAGISGYADIAITIDESGMVSAVSIEAEEPAGFGFGEAAMNAAYSWKFRPAQKENIPVRMEYITRVGFGQ